MWVLNLGCAGIGEVFLTLLPTVVGPIFVGSHCLYLSVDLL